MKKYFFILLLCSQAIFAQVNVPFYGNRKFISNDRADTLEVNWDKSGFATLKSSKPINIPKLALIDSAVFKVLKFNSANVLPTVDKPTLAARNDSIFFWNGNTWLSLLSGGLNKVGYGIILRNESIIVDSSKIATLNALKDSLQSIKKIGNLKKSYSLVNIGSNYSENIIVSKFGMDSSYLKLYSDYDGGVITKIGNLNSGISSDINISQLATAIKTHDNFYTTFYEGDIYKGKNDFFLDSIYLTRKSIMELIHDSISSLKTIDTHNDSTGIFKNNNGSIIPFYNKGAGKWFTKRTEIPTSITDSAKFNGVLNASAIKVGNNKASIDVNGKGTFNGGVVSTGVPLDSNYIKFKGTQNVFIGFNSGYKNSTGFANVFIGYNSGLNSTGQYNVFIGGYAGYSNIQYGSNTYIGYEAGLKCNGINNTFIGYNSGREQISGVGNIYIGGVSKKKFNSSYILGIDIYNDSISTFITGNMSADTLRINAQTRIGKGANYIGMAETDNERLTVVNSGIKNIIIDNAGNIDIKGQYKINGVAISTSGSTYTHPATHPSSMITGLATVATSGDYNDLNNKPVAPNYLTAGDAGLGAVKYNGTTASDGQFYGGTNNPNSITRLNYNGALHAASFQANILYANAKIYPSNSLSTAFLSGNSSNEIVINNDGVINLWTLGGYIKGTGNYSAMLDYAPNSNAPGFAFKGAQYKGLGFDGSDIYITAGGLSSGDSIIIKNNLGAYGKGIFNGGVYHGSTNADSILTTKKYVDSKITGGGTTLVTAGDAGVGAVKYNGTTAGDGQFYGGTVNPIATNRLNFNGSLYITQLNFKTLQTIGSTGTKLFIDNQDDYFTGHEIRGQGMGATALKVFGFLKGIEASVPFSGTAVFGIANGGTGVLGQDIGVPPSANAGVGVRGTSKKGFGIYASSEDGVAAYFNNINATTSNIAEFATTGTKKVIIDKDGNVDIQGQYKINGVVISAGGSSLPSQTGNAGKLLTTDGASLSWANGLNTVVAGDASLGAVKYNGNTPAAGQFYGSTINPTNYTRLNYDGIFVASQIYSNTNNSVGISAITGQGSGTNGVGITGNAIGAGNSIGVKGNATAGNIPLVANLISGTSDIAKFQINSTDYATISSTGKGTFNGGVVSTGVPLDSNYIKFKGTQNTFIGINAGFYTKGTGNSGIGAYALQKNSSGSLNIGLGLGALQNNTSGSQNISIGCYNMQNNTNGVRNTAIGVAAMISNISGNSNTSIGYNSLINNISGNYNIALGQEAMQGNKSGNDNISIGYLSDVKNGNNNIIIGWLNSNKYNTSNILSINSSAATDTITPFLIGDMLLDTLRINAQTRIGKGQNYTEVSVEGKLTTTQPTINIAVSKTPSSSSAPGTKGDICWDANYVYICIETNTWKRSPINSW